MLANAAIVEAVAAAIAELDLPNLVVDPVMIAKGGDRLLERGGGRGDQGRAAAAGRSRDAEHARSRGAGRDRRSGRSTTCARPARRILRAGPARRSGEGGAPATARSRSTSCARRHGQFELRGPRFETRHTHGTGCTLASAIAANLALGLDDRGALVQAREYLEGAIRHAPGLGRGTGRSTISGGYTEMDGAVARSRSAKLGAGSSIGGAR